MSGYIQRPIALWLRRLTAIVPPIILLALGIDATTALVVSQAVLALALPITLVPLLVLTTSSQVMGAMRPGPAVLLRRRHRHRPHHRHGRRAARAAGHRATLSHAPRPHDHDSARASSPSRPRVGARRVVARSAPHGPVD